MRKEKIPDGFQGTAHLVFHRTDRDSQLVAYFLIALTSLRDNSKIRLLFGGSLAIARSSIFYNTHHPYDFLPDCKLPVCHRISPFAICGR